MVKRFITKLPFLIIILLPQWLLMAVRASHKEESTVPIEMLLYTSIVLAAITLNSFVAQNERLSLEVFYWTVFIGFLIIIISSATIVLRFEDNEAKTLILNPTKGKIVSVSAFLLALVYYTFGDYFFSKVKIDFVIEQEYKVSLNGLIKGLISFIKPIPAKLLISVLITLALHTIFPYQSSIVNHLTVLGGVIGVVSLFRASDKN